MSIDDILKLTLTQFEARILDIFKIQEHFKAEKGKGRVKKKTMRELQKAAKSCGISPPKSARKE